MRWYKNNYRKNKMWKKEETLVACKVHREKNKEIAAYDYNNRG